MSFDERRIESPVVMGKCDAADVRGGEKCNYCKCMGKMTWAVPES